MLGPSTSYRALGCCGLIIVGFFMGIDQENALGRHRNTKRRESDSVSSQVHSRCLARCAAWHRVYLSPWMLFTPLGICLRGQQCQRVHSVSSSDDLLWWIADRNELYETIQLNFLVRHDHGGCVGLFHGLCHRLSDPNDKSLDTQCLWNGEILRANPDGSDCLYRGCRAFSVKDDMLFFFLFPLDKDIALVDLESVRSRWFRSFRKRQSNRNEAKS